MSMVKLGSINSLTISRFSAYGAYLAAADDVEILLPRRYVTDAMHEGDVIDVFVYTDSEDLLVAVTEKPVAMVGEFALMRVAEVNRMGAFMDWGLPKNLLVPFGEQRQRMEQGRWYIVYVYIDHNTSRIVGSAKLSKWLGNTIPRYRAGDEVDALIVQRSDVGYRIIIDNLHWGIIYHNEIFKPLRIGEHQRVRVKAIRDDGKIDAVLGAHAIDRISELAERIVTYLQAHGGRMAITDASSPQLIQSTFACSKKDYKRAIGMLLKNGRVTLSDGATELCLQ